MSSLSMSRSTIQNQTQDSTTSQEGNLQMLYVVLHISKHVKQWKKSRGHHFVPECNHAQKSRTNQSCQFFCCFLLPRFVWSPSQPFFCVITQHSSLPLLPMNGHTTGFHPCQSNATTSPLCSDALPSVVAHAQKLLYLHELQG